MASSPCFADSFESLVVSDGGDICSYSFCYVDKTTKTAFIEPLCTREKYRSMGFGKAMLQGILNRLQTMDITAFYVTSFAEHRKEFYNKAGFETIARIGYWYKEI